MPTEMPEPGKAPPNASPPPSPTELLPPGTPVPEPGAPPPRPSLPPTKSRLLLALAIAGVSDVLSIGSQFLEPAQLILDLSTAALLFAVLGRRWLLLPGLIMEAIPVLALFPTWILVVVSIGAWGTIQRHQAGSTGGDRNH